MNKNAAKENTCSTPYYIPRLDCRYYDLAVVHTIKYYLFTLRRVAEWEHYKHNVLHFSSPGNDQNSK